MKILEIRTGKNKKNLLNTTDNFVKASLVKMKIEIELETKKRQRLLLENPERIKQTQPQSYKIQPSERITAAIISEQTFESPETQVDSNEK